MDIKGFAVNVCKVVGVFLSFALVFRKQLFPKVASAQKPEEDTNANDGNSEEELEKPHEKPDDKPQEKQDVLSETQEEEKQEVPASKWRLPIRFARYFSYPSR